MTGVTQQPTIASIPGLTAALAAKRALTDGAFTVAVNLNNGTLVANAPANTVAQEWNNAAVDFHADETDITNTASGAGSTLKRWMVGGVLVCSIPKYGGLAFPNGGVLRQIDGSYIGTYGAFYANGFQSDGGYKHGANQVVGARQAAVADVAAADAAAAVAADASDLATAITLVNELKGIVNALVTLANEDKAQLNSLLAKLRAATGHGLIA